MSQTVSVPALKPFVYEGRSYVRGDIVAMTPIDAAVSGARGDVALERGAMVAKDQEPEPVTRRRRRSYRRRDMVAEPTE